MKKKALVSLSDKTDILDFAKRMSQDFDFISTGGTRQHLEQGGIKCTSVAQITGAEEILDGRVKTLHPKIHAAILSRRSAKDNATLNRLKIENIDMVVVNFYPFENAVLKNKNLPYAKLLELIDIGGPTMLRAAAKNYPFVIPVCDPKDYQEIAQIWAKKKEIALADRKKLAAKAFEICSGLDLAIANYLAKNKKKYFFLQNKKKLRYGENPHQKGWLYSSSATPECLAQLEVLQGKSLSYNNYLDIQSAIRVIMEFKSSAKAPYLTSIIKHNNPCGLASGTCSQESLQKAWQSDEVSAFGSIIAHNKKVNLDFAKFLVSPEIPHYTFKWQVTGYLPQKVKKKFFEILIAPDYESKALELLENHSKATLLKYPMNQFLKKNKKSAKSLHFLDGVVLEQEKDTALEKNFLCKTKKKFPLSLYPLARFGITCCKNSKSNAISLVREYAPSCYQLLGAGCGQPNRIDALVKLALPKMQENLKREYQNLNPKENYENWYSKQLQKSILISDAFFPFPDIVEAASYYKIGYLVQPAGSKMDSSVVELCDKKNIAMLQTGIRHFLH